MGRGNDVPGMIHYHTYGIIGANHTKEDQEVRKDQFGADQNSGRPPDICVLCQTAQQQRDRLLGALEHFASGYLCPSCFVDYKPWEPTLHGIDGYNSNSFTYNMLKQNPAGAIEPPAFTEAPGYEEAPGSWY